MKKDTSSISEKTDKQYFHVTKYKKAKLVNGFSIKTNLKLTGVEDFIEWFTSELKIKATNYFSSLLSKTRLLAVPVVADHEDSRLHCRSGPPSIFLCLLMLLVVLSHIKKSIIPSISIITVAILIPVNNAFSLTTEKIEQLMSFDLKKRTVESINKIKKEKENGTYISPDPAKSGVKLKSPTQLEFITTTKRLASEYEKKNQAEIKILNEQIKLQRERNAKSSRLNSIITNSAEKHETGDSQSSNIASKNVTNGQSKELKRTQTDAKWTTLEALDLKKYKDNVENKMKLTPEEEQEQSEREELHKRFKKSN